jgi:hypothetical protein
MPRTVYQCPKPRLAQGGPPLKPGSVGTEGCSVWIVCSFQVTAKDPSEPDADEGVATLNARANWLRAAAGPGAVAPASWRSSRVVADQSGSSTAPVCPCAVAVALENATVPKLVSDSVAQKLVLARILQ